MFEYSVGKLLSKCAFSQKWEIFPSWLFQKWEIKFQKWETSQLFREKLNSDRVIVWEHGHRIRLVETFQSHFVSSKTAAYQESWSRKSFRLFLFQAFLFTGDPVQVFFK